MPRSTAGGLRGRDVVVLALTLAAAATCAPRAPGVPLANRSGPVTMVGELGGAPYRIDVPPGWNGGLVMYCHGYRGSPVRFDARGPDAMAQAFGALGYAVAQSGYSAGGYAVREAVHDTEALRLHFAAKVGPPIEAWISGSSLGGSVTMMLLETYPTTYEGGLALCAPLGPLLDYAKVLTFDPLVLFEYLFPGQLPSPARVPADFVTTQARTDALERVLDGNPAAAEKLRRFSTARTNKEQAMNLDLFTHILGEQQRRWGGNAFDNRNTIYTGTGDNVAVNDGVKRYRADDQALALAIRDYTPTGQLARPLLSVRSVNDPLIGAYSSDRYSEIAQSAGNGEFFAQQYVRDSGHCTFSADQLKSAFGELLRWRRTGARPTPGAVPAWDGNTR
jgi:pimeloyl-ACP methyl ester carboxylesterase